MLVGGAGNDIISGGLGNDTVTYTLGDGSDTVDGGAGTDTLSIIGTAGADTLDVLFNGAVLSAFEGGTVTGVESITADLLGGVDRLSYAGTTADVTVDLAAGTASGFASIAGIENVTGGSGADTLIGAGNVLANNLAGGAGDDTYFADSNDTITEAAGGGTNSVFTNSAAFTLAANVENLTFTGAGGFTGTGNAVEQRDHRWVGDRRAERRRRQRHADRQRRRRFARRRRRQRPPDRRRRQRCHERRCRQRHLRVRGRFRQRHDHWLRRQPDGWSGPARHLGALAITAANFATNVIITDLGSDTLVSIGTNSILLVGVNGVGANAITQQDFMLH